VIDELTQYEIRRAAWIADAAPKLAKRMEEMTNDQINHAWNVMRDDYKHAVWNALPADLQDRVRSIRESGASKKRRAA